jgi:hypothetical protein
MRAGRQAASRWRRPQTVCSSRAMFATEEELLNLSELAAGLGLFRPRAMSLAPPRRQYS